VATRRWVSRADRTVPCGVAELQRAAALHRNFSLSGERGASRADGAPSQDRCIAAPGQVSGTCSSVTLPRKSKSWRSDPAARPGHGEVSALRPQSGSPPPRVSSGRERGASRATLGCTRLSNNREVGALSPGASGVCPRSSPSSPSSEIPPKIEVGRPGRPPVEAAWAVWAHLGPPLGTPPAALAEPRRESLRFCRGVTNFEPPQLRTQTR